VLSIGAFAAVSGDGSPATATPFYSETDEAGDIWTPASVLRRQAAALAEAKGRRGRQKALPRAFLTYLARVLINYDTRCSQLWERQTAESGVPATLARQAQFAAFAEAVNVGIVGAYGTDPSGLRGLALALRGLCQNDTSAKRQVAFTLALLPRELQPVAEIGALVADFTEGDSTSSSQAAYAAAEATDLALQRLPSQSLARRLAQLVPDAIATPEIDVGRGCYRPGDSALIAAAALSSLEARLDGGEGFGVGALAASELPSVERPELLDPLFGPLGRSPLARKRALGAQQFALLALSGALCTAAVRSVLQPLDVVKTGVQLARAQGQDGVGEQAGDGASAASLGEYVDAACELTLADGPAALYKGVDATLALASVSGFASFGLNELFRRWLEEWFGGGPEEPGPLVVLVASVLAVLAAALVSCPLETLRVRAMAPKESRSFAALTSDALAEGAGKLWAGLGLLWAREVPFVSCKFFVFDMASRALFGLFPDAAEGAGASLAISAAAGGLAGLAAAVVSNPPDVLVTRVSAGAEGGRGADGGRAQAHSDPELHGGNASRLDLWSGLGARCVYFSINICAQFLLYDTVKGLLGVGASDLQLVLDVFGIAAKAESVLES